MLSLTSGCTLARVIRLSKCMRYNRHMIKLNKFQSKAVKAIAPLDGQENFFDKLESESHKKYGLTRWQITTCLDEFEKMGLLTVKSNEALTDCTIRLSSDLLSYQQEKRFEILKSVFRYLFQFAVGVSGGLCVALVTGLFF